MRWLRDIKNQFLILGIISWYAIVLMADTSLEVMAITISLLNYLSFKKVFPQLGWRNLWKPFFIGISFDQLMVSFGFIRVSTMGLLPIWLICLWVTFVLSTPLYQEQVWLRSSFWNQLIKKERDHLLGNFILSGFGGVLGLSSYLMGERLGILIFKNQATLFIYFFFWSVFFHYLQKRSEIVSSK